MDVFDLPRGRGAIKLIKSPDLIAVRASTGGDLASLVAMTEAPETGPELAGFRVMRVPGTREAMESTLDRVRKHHDVDAATHVFHIPSDTAPIVATGKLTLRFKSDSSNDQRQDLLDKFALQVVDSSIRKSAGGSDIESYTVMVTPDSPNPLKVADALLKEDIVTLAEPDLATPGKLFAFALPSDALMEAQWHLRNTGVQFGTSLGLLAGADARVVDAWETLESLGSPSCVVAIIDDGFDLSHPDLAGATKIVAPRDFESNTNDPRPRRFNPDPSKGDYHGTACAGVAVGNADGSGIVGAAPNCRLMPVRWGLELSDDSIRSWFGYVAAQGAWVVSCSWGASPRAYTLSTVMDEAISDCARQGRNGLGCVVVFAAGNENSDVNDPAGGTVSGFATHPDVIAVAACNSRDQRSNYSNFGREISVCAPSNGAGGRGIVTSDVRGVFTFGGNTVEAGYAAGDYTRSFGGTSSATPLVAGVCALVLSANPSLTAAQVKSILETTARRIGPASSYVNGHSIYFGSGCVNAKAAVLQARGGLLRATTPPPLSLFENEFFGIERHEMIAAAAERLLSATAQQAIAGITAALGPNIPLAELAAWPDLIKGKRPSPNLDADTNDFLTQFPNNGSSDWHFVNLPLGIASYDAAAQAGFTRADDIVQMLKKVIAVLQGNSTFISKLNALRWVAHLVGDIHQPVHVGCGFIAPGNPPTIVSDPAVILAQQLKHDRGGNDILLPIGGNVGLHGYWDSTLAGTIQEEAAPTPFAFAPTLPLRSFTTLVERSPVPAATAPIEQWPVLWAEESLASAREAYKTLKITAKAGTKFKVSWEGKSAYDQRCSPILSRRLTDSAQRLALLLNTLLG